MKVNFADVEEKSYEPIPSGSYTVNISDGEERQSGPNSKVPGTPMINWEFTVAEGNFEGRKLWSNTMCAGAGAGILKSLLRATGKFDVDSDADLDFNIDDVVGSTIKVVVGQREYNGDTQNNIKKFKALDDSSSSGDGSLLPS